MGEWLLAIDPGSDGAAAVFDGTALVHVLAFKQDPNWPSALEFLVRAGLPDRVVIEHVHAFAGDGRKSAFTFGGNNALALDALKRGGAKGVEFISPTDWQMKLRLPQHRLIRDRAKRRDARIADYKKYAITVFPQTIAWFPQVGKAKCDIFGAVLIGYAATLGLKGKKYLS